tara:strand:- start:43 stop:261 length:219 start_codon:yes stop_codon:yes gene_type:complete
MPVLTVKSMSSLLVVLPAIVIVLDAHPQEFHVQVMRMVSPTVAENVYIALALPLASAVRSSETTCIPATNKV